MAKRNTKWHKKQVSTRNGIITLGFLTVVTLILIPVLGQWQSSNSNAATAPGVGAACTVNGVKGTCKLTSSGAGGNAAFYPGHCPGAADVQCLATVSCSTPAGKGTCLPTGSKSTSNGAFIPGYCPGPNNVQCYVTNGNITTTNDNACKAKGGTCESTGAHKDGQGGNYVSNLCPGPNNIKCWVPATNVAYVASKNAPKITDNSLVPNPADDQLLWKLGLAWDPITQITKGVPLTASNKPKNYHLALTFSGTVSYTRGVQPQTQTISYTQTYTVNGTTFNMTTPIQLSKLLNMNSSTVKGLNVTIKNVSLTVTVWANANGSIQQSPPYPTLKTIIGSSGE